MLVTLKSILQKARRGNYAVGAFNINNLEILQAALEAAKETRSPLILATSEGAIHYAGMDYLLALARVAGKTALPVAFHLDHGKNLDLIKLAIKSGYTSVMFDGSTLPYEDNTRSTKKVVSWAAPRDVSVEAELGAIKGIEDLVSVSEKEAVLTNPEQAGEFIQKTGCDALAVAIGTSHGAYKFKSVPRLDIARLKKIRANTNVPLVLHGASGVPEETLALAKKYGAELEGARGVSDEMIRAAIKNGINKINIDTDLRLGFTAAVRAVFAQNPKVFDPREILKPAKEQMKKIIMAKMKLFGSAGKSKY